MKKLKFYGFTIIEVSLVIAIGGLILLMVFIALPGLRASQRDADRRDSVILFIDNIKKYQTNNRGALPGVNPTTVVWSDELKNSTGSEATWGGFYRDYLGERFMDANGENFKISVVKCGSATAPDQECDTQELKDLYESQFPNDYTIYVVIQASCYGDRAVLASNPRRVAVLYKLEGAGVYCNNS